jgi:hypothetical protein
MDRLCKLRGIAERLVIGAIKDGERWHQPGVKWSVDRADVGPVARGLHPVAVCHRCPGIIRANQVKRKVLDAAVDALLVTMNRPAAAGQND